MTVTPTSELLALLDRAGAVGNQAAPGILLRDAGEARAFVHGQIAACVLPRRLDVRLDGEIIVACHVAGGRLMQVAPAGGPLFQIGDMADASPALDGVEALADLLDSCAPGTRLSVTFAHWVADDMPAHAGVPSGQLARLWDLDSPGPPLSLRSIAEELGDAVLVSAVLEGDQLAILKGTQADMGRLADLAETVLPGVEAALGWADDPGPGLVLLGNNGWEGADLVILKGTDALVLALVLPADLPDLVQAWFAALRV